MAVVSSCCETLGSFHVTNETLFIFKSHYDIWYIKLGMTSSHYGLNGLGYPRATKVTTKRSDNVSLSKSQKVILVRIVL